MADLLLSPKYKAFLRCNAPVEFLEGTTAAGKTTVGAFKFVLKVAQSPKRIHILSGLDLGTIEKNLISKELGILDLFGGLIKYNPGGRGENSLPHLALDSPNGKKIIYVLGYDNKARWKKALGGQYGCLYIDEINIADMEYVREASMRCDYLMATLNPDDPGLPIYSEFINHARPLPDWEQETPPEILQELTQEPKEGWVHWFFSFEHNAGLPQDKKEHILQMVPLGTKLYKNKVLGLRGRATGLVFNLERKNLITERALRHLLLDKAAPVSFVRFSAGVDTSYSIHSPDTFAFVFTAILSDRRKITLAAEEINNSERVLSGKAPLTPSDLPALIVDFAERQRQRWGFGRSIFIDSADEATILECQKYKRQHGCIYEFVPAWKQTQIIDRIHLESGWLARGEHLIVEDTCGPLVREMNLYSWDEKKDNCPEDRNDHTINAEQYSWLPYKYEIGTTDLK